MLKLTNLWKFEFNWLSKLRDNNYERRKKPCHTKLRAFRCLISRPQNLILRSRNQNYVTSEGDVSHNVILSTATQVRFYANNFESLPIGSTAFKHYNAMDSQMREHQWFWSRSHQSVGSNSHKPFWDMAHNQCTPKVSSMSQKGYFWKLCSWLG